ncbi:MULTISPECIES: glutaredoxin family protein [unclassified Arthrobacter]|uniref:glutaredoxin family protein n=1 Tax=unclassified Arthrobacter TaxID=235627 RepID=UPI001491AEDD|nr:MULTISPECIES: glutaredoxin family protein [unclassified Arthrobacter]MBE0009520.1 glutaredoxin family protein [Arthrobacter sp. AET 35A]NOJ63432.1 glutaredoxin family protein [Arthrobacter sp. 147(2020)]
MTPTPPSDVPEGEVRAPRVELLTRPDCHLCADARAVVELVCGELAVPWRELSTEERSDLLEKFAEEIPVLFIDGVQRDFWKIDERRLRSLLAP